MKLLTVPKMLDPTHPWLWILPVIPTSVITMQEWGFLKYAVKIGGQWTNQTVDNNW